MEKVIGILGGMGSYATLDFMKKIVENTPANKDWEHLHIISDINPKIPSRTRAILYNEISPVKEMIKSIKQLEKCNVDFVVIPCNSAHYFLPQIQPKVNVKILNMLKITANYISKKPNIKKVGIIGGYITTEKKLYNKYLKNIKVIYGNDEMKKESYEIIEQVKLNQLNKKLENRTKKLIDKFTECDAVILACTELPIALNNTKTQIPTFNPNLIVAKEIVRISKK
jgi:aspartate racemase